MRISVTIFVILITTYVINASVLDPVIENVVHLQASKPPSGVAGIWKKKTIWKPRWVKEWKSAKVTKPVWKKVWSPVQIREWVPIPKPPPGWDTISTPLSPVTPPVKSFKTVHKKEIPLWDPMPYPESQQPPPPPPQDYSCSHGGCGDPSGFGPQQIAEIITSHRYKKHPIDFQSPDYSETVTRLTRVPPGDWRPPQRQPFNQFDFPELPPYLVPPKFQPFHGNDLSQQFKNNHHHHHANQIRFNEPNGKVQVTQSLGIEVNPIQSNGLNHWIPFPPFNNHNRDEGLNVKPPLDRPHESQQQKKNTSQNDVKETSTSSDSELRGKPGFGTHSVNDKLHPRPEGDVIQQAQLVGEYHYSDFDLTKAVVPTRTEQVKVKPEETSKAARIPPNSAEVKLNLPPPKIESKPSVVRKPQFPVIQEVKQSQPQHVQPPREQRPHVSQSQPQHVQPPREQRPHVSQSQPQHVQPPREQKPHVSQTQPQHVQPPREQRPNVSQLQTQQQWRPVPQTQKEQAPRLQQPQQQVLPAQQKPIHRPQQRPPNHNAPAAQQQKPQHVTQSQQNYNRPHQEPSQQQRPQQQQKSQPQPEVIHKVQAQRPQQVANPDFQIQKAITKEIAADFPTTLNSTIFPANHRFALNLDKEHPQKSLTSTQSPARPTTLPPDTNLKPENAFNLHVVYPESTEAIPVFKPLPRQPFDYNPTEGEHVTSSTDTTTPLSVIFPSSSGDSNSTETAADGKVFVVTPTYTIPN